ncbi:uncharacterized protein V1510DRAFT_345429, partial [Dipodascopsis tothii]|uniref:uncharacterized protein n=1 Tax=Dipodascopsis tothii TaxID=44089 RepID=UPI0034CEBFF2
SYDRARHGAAKGTKNIPLHVWSEEDSATFERVLGPSGNLALWTVLPSVELLQRCLDERPNLKPVHVALEMFERQVMRTNFLMKANERLQREVFELQQIAARPPPTPMLGAMPALAAAPAPVAPAMVSAPAVLDAQNGHHYASNGFPPKIPMAAYQNGYAGYYTQFRTQPFT